MAVPFISRLRLNPQNKDLPAKYYPAAAYIAEINVNQLADEISDNSSLTQSDVNGVINSLLRILPKYLLLGYKVRLDNFGIFKIGLKTNCKGYDKATEVTANDIAGIRMMFTPDIMLKSKLQKPQYVKLDARFIADSEDTTTDSSASQGSPSDPIGA